MAIYQQMKGIQIQLVDQITGKPLVGRTLRSSIITDDQRNSTIDDLIQWAPSTADVDVVESSVSLVDLTQNPSEIARYSLNEPIAIAS